jgi:hypothetical protein
MRRPALEGFVRVKRGVDASIDNPGAEAAGQPANFISAQGITGVDTDAHYISPLNGFRDYLFQGLIYENGFAGRRGGCSGNNKQPSWCDDGSTKRIIAWIHQVNAHRFLPFLVRVMAASVSVLVIDRLSRRDPEASPITNLAGHIVSHATKLLREAVSNTDHYQASNTKFKWVAVHVSGEFYREEVFGDLVNYGHHSRSIISHDTPDHCAIRFPPPVSNFM